MKEVKIRQARNADLENLYRFEQGVVTAERPFDITIKEGKVNYYDIPEMIAADHIELLVAVVDEKVVGSGYARIETGRTYLKHAQHAYLGFMFVDPEYRGLGINKQIIEALKNWSTEKGITELRLDVYCENDPAIKAYEKAGFTKHKVQMRLGLAD